MAGRKKEFIEPRTTPTTRTVEDSGPHKLTGCGAILLNETNGGGYFLTKTNAQAIKLAP